MAPYKYVRVEVNPPIGWVIFNRPEKLNAMNKGMLSEAVKAVEDLERVGGVHFIAFTGAGRAFSAGIDLSEVSKAGSPEEAGEVFEALAKFFRKVLLTSKPTIAAINGVAAGGGAELVWVVDLSVAVRDARILWPEARWGLIPPALSTIGLDALGPARAALIAMTSGGLTAEEAYRLGIISSLVESVNELREGVRKLVEEVMANSPSAIESIVRLMRTAKAKQLLEAGISELLRLSKSSALIEAAKVFVESRRSPEYKWD